MEPFTLILRQKFILLTQILNEWSVHIERNHIKTILHSRQSFTVSIMSSKVQSRDWQIFIRTSVVMLFPLLSLAMEAELTPLRSFKSRLFMPLSISIFHSLL